MINKSTLCDNIIFMARADACLNPYGKRYMGDHRYVVTALCGCGNAHRDTTYGRVGDVQFELVVDHDHFDAVSCRLLDRTEYFSW